MGRGFALNAELLYNNSMRYTNNEMWVFLSHSVKDYEKVRLVRNILEEEGLRPLMFFLLCLENEEEINDLIKREINCRTRFILCDSVNAQASKWVQKEVEYIKSKDRIYEIVDLNTPIDKIRQQLKQFARKTRLFVSYNREEHELAKQYALRMKKYDFDVYMDMLWDYNQPYVQNYEEETIRNLEDSTKEGTIVAFVNERILKTPDNQYGSCRYEIISSLQFCKRKGISISILTFTKESSLIEKLLMDKALSSICKRNIFSLDSMSLKKKCDFAVEQTLRTLMTKGTIFTLAFNLKNGINCTKDIEEADWIYETFQNK